VDIQTQKHDPGSSEKYVVGCLIVCFVTVGVGNQKLSTIRDRPGVSQCL